MQAIKTREHQIFFPDLFFVFLRYRVFPVMVGILIICFLGSYPLVKKGDSILSWTIFCFFLEKIVVSKRFYVLYLAKDNFFYVPKKAFFSDEDSRNFYEIFKKRKIFGRRPRLRRRIKRNSL